MSNIRSLLHDQRLLESGIAEIRSYAAGEPIIEEGSSERTLFLIRSGCVRVLERIQLEDLRQIKPGICDMADGDVFGELCLFESGPRLATVLAVEATEAVVFDADALMNHLDQNPEFGYRVLKELFALLACRLRQTDRRAGSLFAWGLKAHGIDQHL